MPIGPARMPLFDHLGELRMRLVRIVVSLFIAMCVFYMATPTIIQFMCLPVADYLPKGDDGLVARSRFVSRLRCGRRLSHACLLFCGRFLRSSCRP